MHFKFLLSFILFNLVLPDTLQASKNTKWEFSDWGDSCIIRADNSGVKLVILYFHFQTIEMELLSIDRPGLLANV